MFEDWMKKFLKSEDSKKAFSKSVDSKITVFCKLLTQDKYLEHVRFKNVVLGIYLIRNHAPDVKLWCLRTRRRNS